MGLHLAGIRVSASTAVFPSTAAPGSFFTALQSHHLWFAATQLFSESLAGCYKYQHSDHLNRSKRRQPCLLAVRPRRTRFAEASFASRVVYFGRVIGAMSATSRGNLASSAEISGKQGWLSYAKWWLRNFRQHAQTGSIPLAISSSLWFISTIAMVSSDHSMCAMDASTDDTRQRGRHMIGVVVSVALISLAWSAAANRAAVHGRNLAANETGQARSQLRVLMKKRAYVMLQHSWYFMLLVTVLLVSTLLMLFVPHRYCLAPAMRIQVTGLILTISKQLTLYMLHDARVIASRSQAASIWFALCFCPCRRRLQQMPPLQVLELRPHRHLRFTL